MREFFILFGSETGTAIEVAETIARSAMRRHIKPILLPMNEFNTDIIFTTPFIVFVCSTTGHGEEPRNMRMFWKFLLRKSHSSSCLSGLKFAVFGLGDSSYPLFNVVGKKLYRRLIQMGASPICERGDGDDQHFLGYDGMFHPWMTTFIQELEAMYPSIEPNIPDSVLLPPSVQFKLLDNDIEHGLFKQNFNSVVIENSRVTSDNHFQNVISISFKTDIKYESGDILVVYPENDSKEIDELVKVLGWADLADKPLALKYCNKNLPRPVDANITIRTILKKFTEPLSCPKSRFFFELLSYFTENETFRGKLLEIAKNQDEFIDYCYRPRRTAFEIIRDFSPLNIPIDYVFDLFSPMKAREFSISSYQPNKKLLEITVGIIRYKTIMRTERFGICTRWLSYLSKGDKVQIYVKPGTLPCSDDVDIPIICISPGLGIAPIKSILEKRISILSTRKNYLFYGFRYAQKDFLYRDMFLEWERLGMLKLFTAISRETPKKYVQDVLREEKKLIWKLIDTEKAVIYLSGTSKQMPEDVKKAIQDIVAEESGIDYLEAEKYVKLLIKNHRFLIETW